MNTEVEIYKKAAISRNLADRELAKGKISSDEYKDTVRAIDAILEAELEYVREHADCFDEEEE